MGVTADELLQSGRVVRMRNRLWRIDNVLDAEFTASPIDGSDTYPRRFLTEVEELEEGSLPPPDPAKASDPAEQDLLLRAFRLSLVHGSAPLLGLQRSRVIPTPYQLVPLLLAVNKERVRLLLADDVGVGKTVEMGLVTAELIARGVVRRALFVVPANLREQTREALAHFFHIDATIVAGHLLRSLERQLMPGQSVWSAHPFVVVSVDYAKRHPGRILDAGWDLVVFDEAHLCARPHQQKGWRRSTDLQRHDFAMKAATAVPHLMLMTATPHNGHTDSYASLLDLLGVGAVSWSGPASSVPQIHRDRAQDHVVQRRREDIRRWFEEAGEPFPFPERDQDEIVIEMSHAEAGTIDAVRDYTEELAGRSDAQINGIGHVTRSKLLARKRPRLVPIRDQHVLRELVGGVRESLTRPLRDALRADEEVRRRLQELASRIGDGSLSAVRALDIIVWMDVHGKGWLSSHSTRFDDKASGG